MRVEEFFYRSDVNARVMFNKLLPWLELKWHPDALEYKRLQNENRMIKGNDEDSRMIRSRNVEEIIRLHDSFKDIEARKNEIAISLVGEATICENPLTWMIYKNSILEFEKRRESGIEDVFVSLGDLFEHGKIDGVCGLRWKFINEYFQENDNWLSKVNRNERLDSLWSYPSYLDRLRELSIDENFMSQESGWTFFERETPKWRSYKSRFDNIENAGENRGEEMIKPQTGNKYGLRYSPGDGKR